MPSAAHAISNDGREKRFDRTEQRDRKGIRKDRADFFQTESRKRRRRQSRRDRSETGTDRLDIEVQSGGDRSRSADRDQQGRPCWPQAPYHKNNRDRQE